MLKNGTILEPFEAIPGFQLSLHQAPKSIQRELQEIVPSVNFSITLPYLIPVLQRASCDLVNFGDDIELEKDRLLQAYIKFAKNFCDIILEEGHWADFIDPCSGLPMISDTSGRTFNEVESCQRLLDYRVMNAGCCKVLLHPKWGAAVYPSTIITTAPEDVLRRTLLSNALITTGSS